MTADLRARLTPFVTAIVTELVEEAVEHIETTARERLRAALAPRPIVQRDTKPANKAKRKPPRKVKRSRAATPARSRRTIRKANPTPARSNPESIATREMASAQPVAKATPAPEAPPSARPCGCGPRGRHRSTCAFGQLKRDQRAVESAEVEADEPVEYAPPTPAARADRFAAIEQAAQKRTGTLPTTTATFRTDGRL